MLRDRNRRPIFIIKRRGNREIALRYPSYPKFLIKDYEYIAKKARKAIRKKIKQNERIPFTAKGSRICDVRTLRGYCMPVSNLIRELLRRLNLNSELVQIHAGTKTHYAVYVPRDNVIIDATITQFPKRLHHYKYAWKLENYPLRKYISKYISKYINENTKAIELL
ncbi:MAG: hypothetical protein ACTSYD_02450 [Candidatus Heimdallarchaeaceae archaeon]